MISSVRKVLAAGVTVSLFIAVPAQAACWTEGAVAAAKVRDLETMLMVSALRCRASGHDFLSKYNQFVRGGRPALTEANDRLRAHFSADVGAARGLNDYDRYVTSLANRYGAGADGLSCRDLESITSAAASAGSSFHGLEQLAERADVHPVLTGRMCPISIAQAR
jgi:hypothetical protein